MNNDLGIGLWQYRVRNTLTKLKWKLNWRNRQRVDNFFKWLRDKMWITFVGITPVKIVGRRYYREYDDDRYYDILYLVVRKFFNTKEVTTIEDYY